MPQKHTHPLTCIKRAKKKTRALWETFCVRAINYLQINAMNTLACVEYYIIIRKAI